MKNKLKILNTVFCRNSLYTLNDLLKIPRHEDELNTFMDYLYNDTIFKDALFLASPELFYRWKSAIEADLSNAVTDKSKEYRKLAISILKYYIRICSRATPFGLFSSYSIIDLEKEVSTTHSGGNFIPFYSVDLNIVFKILRKINNNPNIIKQQDYVINNTLYNIGKEYRYVEVTHSKEDSRDYILNSFERNEVLDLIISETKSPKSFADLVSLLLDSVDSIEIEQAEEYLSSLIEAQLLIGEFQLYLNHETPPLQQIINLFEKKEPLLYDPEINILHKKIKKINDSLAALEKKEIGNNIQYYEEIFHVLDELEITYNKKFVINCNLKHTDIVPVIPEKTQKNIREAIEILSALTTLKQQTHKTLDEFKEKFTERYGENLMPLNIALDNEIGIGYSNNSNNAIQSDLVKKIQVNAEGSEDQQIEHSLKIKRIWNNILAKAKYSKLSEIDLSNDEFRNLIHTEKTENNINLPDSLHAMVSVVDDNKILIKGIGGVSALNLIGRFTCFDPEAAALASEISKAESQNNVNAISAEFDYIPDNRSSNLLVRNIKREYTLGYISKNSTVSHIDLDDIYAGVRYGKIVLWSQKHKSMIKLYNSHAHNFHINSMPIYHFLCDLQCQNITEYLHINFDQLIFSYNNHFPRISWKNLILSPATWRITTSELKYLFPQKNDEDLLSYFNKIKSYYTIPRYVYLKDSGDNQLLIDTENKILLEIVRDAINEKESLILIEVLYNLNHKGIHDNEYIFPIINEKSNNSLEVVSPKKSLKRKFIPTNEWVFFKIYLGIETANKLLATEIPSLIETLKKKNLIEKWFFIRYYDPNFHIRLRFQYDNNKTKLSDILSIVNQKLKYYSDTHYISKIDISTYEREVERYGYHLMINAESFFTMDSEIIIELLKRIKADATGDERVKYFILIKYIDHYLNFLQLSLDTRINLFGNLYNAFQTEFQANKKTRKDIDSIYRQDFEHLSEFLHHRNEYDDIIENTISRFAPDIKKFIGRTDIITSFIHMTINRFAKLEPRKNELLIYGVLEKHYRAMNGKLNLKV
ncbi:thiopeptide-type bacteriocin biosynthesis domain-containing protein [Chryseobacterium vrystaatense]|uniref:Thiopeptide-type bacteriocin biosynthesis domain-containing protein n=1 Tax=Chryseobacterium vrystaatense TaxID=307480 RepID=A0A1M5GAP6_9FLAO|nr:thiopeptide-type bacteriocin biosynthesis domain-containing protein [Chryseobacterium vrystaatense]